MYARLDQAKREIRVLRLLPGQKNEDIRCQLEIISLANPDHAPFDALSYVWGTSKESRHMSIGARSVGITDNLHAALLHLRHPDVARALWVDAVCINQPDLEERKAQVSMMDQIYALASRVLAWVPEYGNEELVFASIRAIAADPALHWVRAHLGDREREPAIDVSAINIKLFFSNAWFGRVWTLQEAVVARDMVYVCGDAVLSTAQVRAFRQSFQEHFGRRQCCSVPRDAGGGEWRAVGQEVQYVLDETEQMDELRRRVASAGGRGARPGFLEVVSKTRHREATDPRDKVYGLFSVSGDLEPELIDYRMDVAEVYTRTALWCITSTGTLDILSHRLPPPTGREIRVKGSRVSEVKGLPSWAPNWEDPVRYYRLMRFHRRQSLLPFYSASGEGSVAKPVLRDEGRLELQGVFCDRIAKLGKQYEDHWDTEYNVYENWRDMAGVDSDPDKPYQDGRCTWLDAYWRTLCNDIGPTENSASSDYHRAGSDLRYAHDRWWWEHLAEKLGESEGNPPGMRIYDLYHARVENSATGRRYFLSEKGYMGMALADAQPGDEIWVLNGGKVPYILRPQESAETMEGRAKPCTFVGDAYVHGIMDGELLRGQKGTPATPRSIVLE